MSSKNKKYSQKEKAQAPPRFTTQAVKAKASLLERSQRFLPHNQEDDMAKLRWIVIFVVILLAIEFTVIAVAMASGAPAQNRNAGQMVPINGNTSGVCNTNTGNSNTLMDPQSPSASLQYSPATQNPSSNLGSSNDLLQASPQTNQCIN